MKVEIEMHTIVMIQNEVVRRIEDTNYLFRTYAFLFSTKNKHWLLHTLRLYFYAVVFTLYISYPFHKKTEFSSFDQLNWTKSHFPHEEIIFRKDVSKSLNHHRLTDCLLGLFLSLYFNWIELELEEKETFNFSSQIDWQTSFMGYNKKKEDRENIFWVKWTIWLPQVYG